MACGFKRARLGDGRADAARYRAGRRSGLASRRSGRRRPGSTLGRVDEASWRRAALGRRSLVAHSIGRMRTSVVMTTFCFCVARFGGGGFTGLCSWETRRVVQSLCVLATSA